MRNSNDEGMKKKNGLHHSLLVKCLETVGGKKNCFNSLTLFTEEFFLYECWCEIDLKW